MGQIIDTVASVLQEEGWNFETLQQGKALATRFYGESGQLRCHAFEVEKDGIFLFYSISPIKVPKNKRQAVAHLLAGLNYGIAIGNFDLNLTYGDIRFKTSIQVQDDRLSLALVKNLIYTNVITMNEYLPSIMSTVHGNVPPEQTLADMDS